MLVVWPSASNPHHLTMLTTLVAQSVSLANPGRLLHVRVRPAKTIRDGRAEAHPSTYSRPRDP